MKKSRLLCLSSAMILLTSCSLFGGGDKPSVEPSEGGSDEVSDVGFVREKTTIKIVTTFNDTYQSVFSSVQSQFAKIEPNVTVEIEKYSSDYAGMAQKCIDGFAVEDYPDITCVYPDSVTDFINNLKALDISEYMTNPEYGWTSDDLDDIPEGYIKEGQSYIIEGTYSLPASKSTEAMFYNRDRLVNLDLSSIDPTINNGNPLTDAYLSNLTWDELFDKLCPAIMSYNDTLADGEKILDTSIEKAAVVGYDSDSNLFITLAKQYGYDYTSVNQVTGKGNLGFVNDGMKDLMKRFNSYYQKGYLQTQGTYSTYTSKLSTLGACLFCIGSTAGAANQYSTTLKEDIGVCKIPSAPGKDYAVISQGPSFAFLDHNDENRALASWLFYKLFTNTANNMAWAIASNYCPIRYSVFEHSGYQKYASLQGKEEGTLDIVTARTGVYANSIGQYLYTSPVFKGSSDARVNVGALLTSCLTSTNIDADIDNLFKVAYDNTLLKM